MVIENGSHFPSARIAEIYLLEGICKNTHDGRATSDVDGQRVRADERGAWTQER